MSENNYWTRLQRRSLSRRTMLRGAALGGAGLAGAVLIGCGDDDDDDEVVEEAGAPAVFETGGAREGRAGLGTEATEEADFDWIFEDPPKNVPILGGTSVSTYSGSDDHFSPWHLGGMSGGGGIYDALFTQYFRGDHVLRMRGIEKHERPDAVTNILTVRPGHMSPNDQGIDRAVHAEDIFGAMRIKNEDITVWSPGLYYVSTDWDQTEVTDDKTIMLVLTQPRNDFYIAANTSFMARELEDMHLSGEKTIQQWDNPVASGAYYQTRFVPGTTIELTRNPGFSRSPWPFIENRKLIKVTDSGTRQAQFRAGKTIAFGGINKLLFDDLLEDLASGDSPRAYGVKSVSQSGGVILALHGGSEPWTDIRAREAVSRAMDVDRLIAVLEGGEGLKSGPGVSRFYQNWKLPEDDPLVVDYLTYDPQRTRELLDAVRADGSVDVDREMTYVAFAGNQADGDRAVLMRQMLNETDWNVQVETVTSQEMTTRVLRRATCEFDLTSPGYPGDYAQQLRAHHTVTNFVAECTNQMDPELDAMIEDFEVTLDVDELAEKAKNIERWLIENWSVIKPLYNSFNRTMYKIVYRNINPTEGSGGYFSWLDESYWPG